MMELRPTRGEGIPVPSHVRMEQNRRGTHAFTRRHRIHYYNSIMSPSAPAAGVYGRPWCRDGISIQNLTLQHPPSFANDAWGRPKEQPCLISVALSFRSSFTSAASKDALDESTMHYGVLGKRLRGTELHSDSQTIDGLADALHETILATPPGVSLLESSQVQIHLPKASLLGQGITFTRFVPYDQVGSTQAKRSLHLRNINVPVLIGVNAHERTRKQPLIVSVWLDGLPDGNAEIYPVLERDLVDVGILDLYWSRVLTPTVGPGVNFL